MENCYTNAECDFQVFIDTDNNSDTGFYGADYRIAGYDGEIHALKHASDDIEAWEWETEDDLLNFNQTIIDDNDIYIEFSDRGASV